MTPGGGERGGERGHLARGKGGEKCWCPHHMPTCPLRLHRAPFAPPQERGSPGCRQTLQVEWPQLLTTAPAQQLHLPPPPRSPNHSSCTNSTTPSTPLTHQTTPAAPTQQPQVPPSLTKPLQLHQLNNPKYPLHSPNHSSCLGSLVSTARPKSASLILAPWVLLARSRFSGCKMVWGRRGTHYSSPPLPLTQNTAPSYLFL